MQLDSLRIQNFRMLEDFSVKKLGRLNLIVGKNNSGKSTVLEALRVYAGNAAPILMKQIAEERGEYKHAKADETPLASFFTGRKLFYKFEDAKTFYINIGTLSSTQSMLHLEFCLFILESNLGGYDQKRVIPRQELLDMLTSSKETKTLDEMQYGFIVRKGNIEHIFSLQDYIKAEPLVVSFLGFIFSNFPTINCNYVPTQLIPHKDLISLWKTIDGTAREDQFIDALKMIEPRIVGVTDVEGVFEIRLEGEEERVPLKSLGEGMSRIFQLALHAFNAKGGFLLIDEFENGLHYSVQEKIWSWLFDLCASEQRDIQLFATTHSWDCIKSFSTVAEKKQNIEATLFRMGRSVKRDENGKIIAVEFNKESLHNLVEDDMELR